MFFLSRKLNAGWRHSARKHNLDLLLLQSSFLITSFPALLVPYFLPFHSKLFQTSLLHSLSFASNVIHPPFLAFLLHSFFFSFLSFLPLRPSFSYSKLPTYSSSSSHSYLYALILQIEHSQMYLHCKVILNHLKQNNMVRKKTQTYHIKHVEQNLGICLINIHFWIVIFLTGEGIFEDHVLQDYRLVVWIIACFIFFLVPACLQVWCP